MATLHPYLGVTKDKGYINKKKKENQRRYILEVNLKDKSIIKWMEENKPYQTALKRLIKEQIAREKKK